MIGETVGNVQPLAVEKGVAMEVECARNLPSVSGDRDKLHQVLVNLLHNAIKFTPHGGKIRITARDGVNGQLRVCVQDTGCGIAAGELDKIFLPFYRGASAQPNSGGAGLGLAITKRLVELHGGAMQLESTVGVGSCFSFTLPTLPS